MNVVPALLDTALLEEARVPGGTQLEGTSQGESSLKITALPVKCQDRQMTVKKEVRMTGKMPK